MEGEDAYEADPIVQEIPVFLSKRFEDQLYVFQYPSSSNKAPLNVKNTSIKPNNQVVQLEVQLNTNSKNFSVERAEDIAEEVDGQSDPEAKTKSAYFKNNMFDSLNLLSSKIVNDPEHYGIGVYNGREYHITPLKGLLRFNPYLSHLHKNDKWKQAKLKDTKDDFSSPQEVLVKFSSATKQELNKIEEVSYKKMMSDIADEPWIKCQWHSEASELSELEKVKLFTENTRVVTQFNSVDSDADKYIRQMVPEDKEEAVVKPALPSNVISFNSLRALPLLDRCQLLLKDAKIMAFQQLLMLLTGCDGLTISSLLKTLPQIAVLVRGNWIVKSEILFPSDTFSAVNGVPADYMCQARDYVVRHRSSAFLSYSSLFQLCLFTKNQFVERSKASSVINVPTEELKEILTGISKLRYNKRWELVLPVDIEFINKYPDVVQRQSIMWEQREIKLNEFFKERGTKDKRQRRKSKSVSEDSGKAKESNAVTESDIKVEKNKSPVAARRNRCSRITISKMDTT